MSRLHLIQRVTTPPEKFRYRFLEDGFTVRSFSYEGWIAGIKHHALDNGYPVPSVEDAEDQLCRTLSGEWCAYEDGTPAGEGFSPRFTIEDFKRGTDVLWHHVLNGAQIVSQQVAEERADICSKCFLNMSVPGCAACHAVANLVASASGGRKTKADSLLKACGWCHCSAQANVWLPTAVTGYGVTDEMLERAPAHCWKANELREARNVNGLTNSATG